MKEARYELTKIVERHELHIRRNDKKINFHHIIHRSDYENNLVSKDFPLNEEGNIIPLNIRVHERLHWIDDHYFHHDITTRVYLANMAFNGELDCIPERMYRVNPTVEFKKKCVIV